MKHFIAQTTGRTFILRMERGDLLREKIFELCKTKKSVKLLFYQA